MIRPINIKLNAAHPELPLVEATTFVGAPSSVFIRGVPRACGNWSITAVNVAVTYPDNTTTTRAAVESADGVWVATIPGTATSGRTASGFQVLADGTDENGAAVTGYVLGFADFSVLAFTPVPAPGGTFWILRYFDAIPAAPKKGDVAVVDGVLKYYNGSTWTPFADLTNYYTKAETDEAIDKLAAYYITYNAAGAAFPTRADLLNAQTYYSGGAARVPTRNDYAVVLADESHGGAEWRYIYAVADGSTTGQWEAQYPIETNDYDALANKPSINGVTLSGNKTGPDIGLKNNFAIGSGLQEVSNNLYAYAGVDGTTTEGQTVYTLGVVASVGSKLYTWDGTTLTDTLKTVSSVNVGTGRIYTSMIPAVYYERAASNDVSRPPTVNVATVAPSPNAVAGNVADAKSVWDELLKLAPDWKTSTAGGTYAKYDVVRYNHNYYYNKTGTNTNTIPSGDTTNWGSLANLAALAHQFLPLAGGTMTGGLHVNGSLDVDYTENGISASIFKVIGSAVNNVRFIYYDGTGYITLYLKDIASLASPAFTGTPTAPTPTAGDNSTKIATTAFVQGRIGQKLEVWLSVNSQTGVVSANYDDGL